MKYSGEASVFIYDQSMSKFMVKDTTAETGRGFLVMSDDMRQYKYGTVQRDCQVDYIMSHIYHHLPFLCL